MLFIPIFHQLKTKYPIYFLLVLPTSLNLASQLKPIEHKDVITPLSHISEILSLKKDKFNYWDRNCRLKWREDINQVFCKKKPSNKGGLSI
jgi:hypothetical protein